MPKLLRRFKGSTSFSFGYEDIVYDLQLYVTLLNNIEDHISGLLIYFFALLFLICYFGYMNVVFNMIDFAI